MKKSSLSQDHNLTQQSKIYLPAHLVHPSLCFSGNGEGSPAVPGRAPPVGEEVQEGGGGGGCETKTKSDVNFVKKINTTVQVTSFVKMPLPTPGLQAPGAGAGQGNKAKERDPMAIDSQHWSCP